MKQIMDLKNLYLAEKSVFLSKIGKDADNEKHRR